ncbi:MAG: hypothetical protein ACE5JA_10310, partial [bacterium]
MKTSIMHFLLTHILALFLVSPALPQEVSIGNQRRFPALSYKGKLYIGTGTGLLTYDHLSDIWTARYVGETPLSNRISALGMDEDILWIATLDGIASSDVRLGNWIVYTKSDGLPSDTILSIGFEEDYVWVGTPRGAGRFDKLTEEWESFREGSGLSSDMVNDIAVYAEKVWLATDYGVSEYDSEYEVWKTYTSETGLLSGSVERVCASRAFLWFFGEKGVSRYDENTRSWSEYFWKEPTIPDQIISEGDSLWLVVGGKIALYDSHLDLFSDFEYEYGLGGREVRYVSVRRDHMWVATDKDIAKFDRSSKTWRFHGPAQGLLPDDFLTVTEFGNSVFAAARDGTTSYQRVPEGRWYQKASPGPVDEEATVGLSFLADERGTGFALPPDNSLLLKGNTTWAFECVGDNWLQPEGTSDLTVLSSIHGGRSLSGRYDDTDLDRTVYGLTFGGAERDLLQEVSLGYGRSEFGRDQLIRSLDMFGVSADVGYGEKTGTAKRVGVSFKGGERRSGFEIDFFTGRRSEDSLSVRDIDYARGTY